MCASREISAELFHRLPDRISFASSANSASSLDVSRPFFKDYRAMLHRTRDYILGREFRFLTSPKRRREGSKRSRLKVPLWRFIAMQETRFCRVRMTRVLNSEPVWRMMLSLIRETISFVRGCCERLTQIANSFRTRNVPRSARIAKVKRSVRFVCD